LIANAAKLKIQQKRKKKEQSFAFIVSWEKLIATRKEALPLSRRDSKLMWDRGCLWLFVQPS
jgi:hypothetical protein